MPDDRVDLEVEMARTSAMLKTLENRFVPLAVAAAIAFHKARGNTRAIVDRHDYDEALNIAAAALSRLLTIYELEDPQRGRMPRLVDLTRERFARGATEVMHDGRTVARELSVRFGDLQSAVTAIKRAGVPFGLAAMPAPPTSVDSDQTQPQPRR